MRMTILRRLLTLLQSSATLADLCSFDDAYGLILATDQLAIGLELYLHPVYSEARQALLIYIDGRVSDATHFERYLTLSIQCANKSNCADAYYYLGQAAQLSYIDLSQVMLTEAMEAIAAQCPLNTQYVEAES